MESVESDLSKEQYIVTLLLKGVSIRDIARKAKCSNTLVQHVKKNIKKYLPPL